MSDGVALGSKTRAGGGGGLSGGALGGTMSMLTTPSSSQARFEKKSLISMRPRVRTASSVTSWIRSAIVLRHGSR